MSGRKTTQFEYDTDAPDLAHQILAAVHAETGDPQYAWAAKAIEQHRIDQKVPVSFETAPPRFDKREWIHYSQVLKKNAAAYPLTVEQMLELSILTTHMLREALPLFKCAPKLTPEIANYIRMEWHPAAEAYVGQGTLQPQEYDREIVPVLMIDRKRLYQYLSTLPMKEADSALISMIESLDFFARNFNPTRRDVVRDEAYSIGPTFAIRSTKKREYYKKEASAFIKELEAFVPQSMAEESSYPLYLEHFSDDDCYANTIRTLNQFLDWHKLYRPGEIVENPGGRYSEHICERKFSTPSYDMQPYLDALQADKDAFRKAQVDSIAQTPTNQPTLLHLMEHPETRAVQQIESAGRLLKASVPQSPEVPASTFRG